MYNGAAKRSRPLLLSRITHPHSPRSPNPLTFAHSGLCGLCGPAGGRARWAAGRQPARFGDHSMRPARRVWSRDRAPAGWRHATRGGAGRAWPAEAGAAAAQGPPSGPARPARRRGERSRRDRVLAHRLMDPASGLAFARDLDVGDGVLEVVAYARHGHDHHVGGARVCGATSSISEGRSGTEPRRARPDAWGTAGDADSSRCLLRGPAEPGRRTGRLRLSALVMGTGITLEDSYDVWPALVLRGRGEAFRHRSAATSGYRVDPQSPTTRVGEAVRQCRAGVPCCGL